MSDLLPAEYILRMGYYPDHHAERDVPVDVFFTHVSARSSINDMELEQEDAELAYDLYWDRFLEAVQDVLAACMEKYHLVPWGEHRKMSRVLSMDDCFWDVVVRPDDTAEYSS